MLPLLHGSKAFLDSYLEERRGFEDRENKISLLCFQSGSEILHLSLENF